MSMYYFLKRATRRLCREITRFYIAIRMLGYPQKMPIYSDAISFLEEYSPDLGKGCWVGGDASQKERNLLLSVIIPAYNVEEYIGNCMESILRQKVSFAYEIIVIDDGSTDATAQQLEKYSHCEQVIILHQKNRGLSAARNKGIDCSRGEYLCFVDSDDELTDGALEALVSKAREEDAKLVVGSFQKTLRNGRVQYTEQLENKKSDGTKLPGFAPGRILHYSVFENLRFPEGYWYEDSIMAQIVQPMCRDSTYTVSHICYKYYSNESGITAISKGSKKSLDSLWITRRLLQERELFGLEYTQQSYEYFLSMVNLTYHRTKLLGPEIAQCIFVVQRMLMNQYYAGYSCVCDHKKGRIQEALQKNDFRKYILACERKHG